MLGLGAILRRHIRTHQRWMARSYAVAQGAGTQALVLGPIVLLVDQPAGNLKATGMGFAWVVNLVVAEWLVRRSEASRRVRRSAPLLDAHLMHSRAAGNASSRASPIADPQRSHRPYVPSSTRRSAASTSER